MMKRQKNTIAWWKFSEKHIDFAGIYYYNISMSIRSDFGMARPSARQADVCAKDTGMVTYRGNGGHYGKDTFTGSEECQRSGRH